MLPAVGGGCDRNVGAGQHPGAGAVRDLSAGPDPEVCARWRLVPGELLSARATHTWAVTRNGDAAILQRFDPADQPGWDYPLRVAAALRGLGWPTPELIEEPLTTPEGVWLLTH